MDSPEDSDLIAFFGQEPEAVDPEEAEFFGSVSFVVDVGDGDTLRCDIGRHHGDLRLALARAGAERVVLSTMGDVERLRIERLHDVETLVASFGREPDLCEARLTLSPTLRLEWGSNVRL